MIHGLQEIKDAPVRDYIPRVWWLPLLAEGEGSILYDKSPKINLNQQGILTYPESQKGLQSPRLH